MSGLTGAAVDEIAARLDAAYAERRRHRVGTIGYAKAEAALEAVYADLRALNGTGRA